MTRPLPVRALVETRPTKAQLAAAGTFLFSLLGSILVARHAGAAWSIDLFLDALYVAGGGGVATGSAVYVKANRPKSLPPEPHAARHYEHPED